jgi:ribosomal-protein-alanine N-acetyltransferase
MSLREGTAADLDTLLAVQRESEDAPQWSEAVWREMLTRTADDVPLRRCFVAVQGNEVVGFLVMSLVGNLAEVESLAVAVAARRQGWGAKLCREGMRWAAKKGGAQVELEVRSQNEGARALYAGLGFVQQGIRKGYYHSPGDDAVLLSATL